MPYIAHGRLPADLFNASGRAFPDVAAAGEDFAIVYDREVGYVSGTSCSAPTFAGVVGLLNDRDSVVRAREIFERDYLKAQINRFGGNISRTAEFVGMERSALHRKLKSLGIA